MYNTILKKLRFNLAKREKYNNKKNKSDMADRRKIQIMSEGRKIVADTYYTFSFCTLYELFSLLKFSFQSHFSSFFTV